MSEHLTPEKKAEWREDDWVEYALDPRAAHARILALLYALDEAERDKAFAEVGYAKATSELERAERERDEARAALARVREVHEHYFDTDRKPGSWDDHLGTTGPEPEDVWRFDRDFRAALAGPNPTDPEGDDRD